MSIFVNTLTLQHLHLKHLKPFHSAFKPDHKEVVFDLGYCNCIAISPIALSLPLISCCFANIRLPLYLHLMLPFLFLKSQIQNK